MWSMRRTESRFELSKEHFEGLFRRAQLNREREFASAYYDRHGRLAANQVVFLVRREAEVASFELEAPKELSPRQGQDASAIAPVAWVDTGFEEAAIDVDDELPPDIGSILLELGVDRLDRLGTVQQRSYVLCIPTIGEIELERGMLPNDSIYFEAVVASAEETVRDQLLVWLHREAPSARPVNESLFERLCRALGSGQ